MTADPPLVLAFDTAGPRIAAALMRGEVLLAGVLEPMDRGQAERLMPLLSALLSDAGLDWRDLAALGVGVGPGNFTGIRIAVAAARGLSLGLGVPAFGITGFELAQGPAASGQVSLPAPRGQAYVQTLAAGRPVDAPRLIDATDPPTLLGDDDLPQRLGRIAAWKWAQGHDLDRRPAPLYIRAPDAAAPAEAPPALIG